jgi:hypothetical protein
MVRASNKCGYMNGICFICYLSVTRQVSNFIRLLCVCGMIFPLELTMFIEDVDEFFVVLWYLIF